MAEPWHRAIHLVAFVSLVLIAIDAFRPPLTRPGFLDEFVWFALYVMAAASVLLFVAFGTLLSLQIMTVLVAAIGIFRGVSFMFYDWRLTPLGLNLLIALYAVIAHRYERQWVER